MIERLQHSARPDKAPTAFCRGSGERSLEVTFHTASLAECSYAETEALEALHQLAQLEEIEAYGTERGAFPWTEVSAPIEEGSDIPFTVREDQEVVLWSAVWNSSQWLKLATQLTGNEDPTHTSVQALLHDLILARAHCQLGRDLLVTLSPNLLAHRTVRPISECNPRTPSAAAQIVGLFLRSRDNYTYFAGRHEHRLLDRGLFFLVLG